MKVLIKGAGDLASGVAYCLYHAGFSIVMTEIEQPTMVRCSVSFGQAVYEKKVEIEGVQAVLVKNADQATKELAKSHIPIIIDPDTTILHQMEFDVVVDAILAKHNINTKIDDAPIVIALGPGFRAGVDADAVIETMRGHYLGSVIYEGEAIPNTGVPGEVGGKSIERLLRASSDGKFFAERKIGDFVHQGDVMAYCGDAPVYASIDGYLRGLLTDGLPVFKGMKIGDIDPRCEQRHCFTFSDKARSLGNATLLAIIHLSREKGLPFVL